MKYIFFIFIFCILFVCPIFYSKELNILEYKSQAIITLESPMIDLMDGKSFAIDGEVFGLMLQVRREVRKRLFGISAQNGKLIGMYRFRGDNCSLVDLSKIENECEREFIEKKENLTTNKDSYSPEDWEKEHNKVKQEYLEEKSALGDSLEEAKKDFINITASYVEGARGTKDQLLLLIKESCCKRGRKDCFILRWGETQEGNETEILKSDMTTFRDFTQFCFDLSNFLEDLARSCPKAQKQFIDLIKKS